MDAPDTKTVELQVEDLECLGSDAGLLTQILEADQIVVQDLRRASQGAREGIKEMLKSKTINGEPLKRNAAVVVTNAR